MNKTLISSVVVALIFILGAAVQFVRGKIVFAIIGAVLGTVYVVLTLIGYKKEKDGKGE